VLSNWRTSDSDLHFLEPWHLILEQEQIVSLGFPCAAQGKVCHYCELAATPSHRMKAMLSKLIPRSFPYYRYELGYRFHNKILGSVDKIQIC
jgi:hypothetical protein